MEKEEILKNECIERLKVLEQLGLMKTVRKEFEKDGTLYYAENMGGAGILYWVEKSTEWENKNLKDIVIYK